MNKNEFKTLIKECLVEIIKKEFAKQWRVFLINKNTKEKFQWKFFAPGIISLNKKIQDLLSKNPHMALDPQKDPEIMNQDKLKPPVHKQVKKDNRNPENIPLNKLDLTKFNLDPYEREELTNLYKRLEKET